MIRLIDGRGRVRQGQTCVAPSSLAFHYHYGRASQLQEGRKPPPPPDIIYPPHLLPKPLLSRFLTLLLLPLCDPSAKKLSESRAKAGPDEEDEFAPGVRLLERLRRGMCCMLALAGDKAKQSGRLLVTLESECQSRKGVRVHQMLKSTKIRVLTPGAEEPEMEEDEETRCPVKRQKKKKKQLVYEDNEEEEKGEQEEKQEEPDEPLIITVPRKVPNYVQLDLNGYVYLWNGRLQPR
ncbi:hypothetical protein B0H16DRAFT_1481448 [Mycena metata]|uniref:Uncharacterized protein n=1 Tax=Mycena metata TaxID=1033252 RepID=A0AAD7GY90_9AGAR|nr:hypothetical protein B0H16DRAFT_1481448 [Mycena metata]